MKSFRPLWLIYLLFLAAPACNMRQNHPEGKLPDVKAVRLEDIDPELFSEYEWYMPYYLGHFPEVANSVQDTGKNRGYINISVWRGSQNFHTYNARIMEGILSLVWFYSTERPWNVYYNNKALKLRIEAALDFWCSIQNEDGRFSEYAVGQWSLAPTAFATKFVGRALWLLSKNNPKIDKTVYERSRQALRKAIYAGFTNKGLWESGRIYTNQYANLWGGALMYLDVWPDEEIKNLLENRFKESMTEFQSPCGFFYEKGGPDWGYDLSTHHSDLQVAWEYFSSKEDKDLIIKKTKDWYEWFSYNAVKEPGNDYFYLNRAIETRQQKGYFINVEMEDPSLERWCPQAEFIPEAQAFQMTKQEYESSAHRLYQEMRLQYPEVRPMDIGNFNAFSPYAFLHYGMKMWLPEEDQKKKAVGNLPYLKNNSFNQIRHDNRSNTSYSFIRKPEYYAIFNSGRIVTSQERYGLGLVWTPKLGTIFQSQSGTDVASYGTRAAGKVKVYESIDLFPVFKMNDEEFTPGEGKQDLAGGILSVSYDLGKEGKKIIIFNMDKITVQVIHGGKFTEVLPLLISDKDSLTISSRQIKLQRNNSIVLINLKGSIQVNSSPFKTDLAEKKCEVIDILAQGKLEYEISFL